MTDTGNETEQGGFVHQTANDRFKGKFGSWFWGSVAVAAIAHFALFLFWPTMSAADIGTTTEEAQVVNLPPQVEIPPPPQQIAQPATPVVAEADVAEDVTLAKTTFESNPVSQLPTPETSSSGTRSKFQAFTPSMVKPTIQNTQEYIDALRENYPPLLKDAGVGGTVLVQFWLSDEGEIVRKAIARSSGHEAMDQAALEVADVLNLTPAMNNGRPVNVVITFPVTFRVR